MTPKKLQRIKKQLESVYEEFLESEEIQNDAITPALLYTNSRDREFAAFLCAILAYGKVAHIQKSVRRILGPLEERPVEKLVGSSDKDLKQITRDWSHRFNTSHDMYRMLQVLRHVYANYESLEHYVEAHPSDTAFALLERLVEKLEQDLTGKVDSSFWFFLPRPSSGSACKRLNLFMRWMVGTSPTDLGLWRKFSKKELLIPVDIHVHRQALLLGLTQRKAADWKTAEDITAMLKRMDPEDPVRFDFALCHVGIRRYQVPFS